MGFLASYILSTLEYEKFQPYAHLIHVQRLIPHQVERLLVLVKIIIFPAFDSQDICVCGKRFFYCVIVLKVSCLFN